MRIYSFRNLTISLLLILSIGLFAVSVYRAATNSFTHDESTSFAIFTWQPVYQNTANNHLLNTWLMQFFSMLIGNSELVLRLPTLLADALYLACGLLILIELENLWLQLAGFALLNFNPFLLDFMFLSRGYGLALGFLMLSLWLLTRAFRSRAQLRFVLFLMFSAVAGALSVLANFAFLDFYLPLLVACLWLLVTDESLRRFTLRHVRPLIVFVVANGLYISFVASKTLDLQRRGELYFGGKDGFVTDTVGTLIRSSLYSVSYSQFSESLISQLLVVICVGLLFLGVYLFFKFKPTPLYLVYLLILTLAVVLPILQHQLLGTLYPIERSALYYLPLFALCFVSGLDIVLQQVNRPLVKAAILVLPLVMAAVVTWHLWRTFNPGTTYTWGYDAHDEQVIELVNQDRALRYPNQTVKLGVSWVMEPSLNFYRVTRNYKWLAPVTRDPLDSAPFDYIYANEADLKKTPFPLASRLADYPDTHTTLLVVNHAPSP